MSSPAKTREPPSSLLSGERAILEEPQVIPQHPTLSTNSDSVTTTMSSHPMIVYTDGSCKGNGKVGSVAGVGVWWGENDPRHVVPVVSLAHSLDIGLCRNLSERCPGQQTNNRAELIAIIRVLETTPADRPLLIKSDSNYSIRSMTEWIWTWKARGWRTSTGGPVQNLSVIKYLDLLLEERRRVRKQSVPAHSGLEGNEGADVLAKAGATLP
ncbi:ribonuclease H-like domain-containing protein, partial [Ganoderma leucocontextum]